MTAEADNLLVTNIQRFSLHDGPGIRTTVFLKGCTLHCPWCSNPENISPKPEKYIKDGNWGVYGKQYSINEIVSECMKDKVYYSGKLGKEEWNIDDARQIEDLPGGVTFSGGECLIHMQDLVPVCKYLKRNEVHLTVETSLFCLPNQIDYALELIDLFYVDIKILDRSRCSKIIGGSLDVFLNNFERIYSWRDKKGRRKPVVVRIPVIGTYTDDDMNRAEVKKLLLNYGEGILKIELIKEHNLAESKYLSLNRRIDFHGIDDIILQTYKSELANTGIPIEICAIY